MVRTQALIFAFHGSTCNAPPNTIRVNAALLALCVITSLKRAFPVHGRGIHKLCRTAHPTPAWYLYYWVTQKLPQICTVILRICIVKVA